MKKILSFLVLWKSIFCLSQTLPIDNSLLFTATKTATVTITLTNDEFDKVCISCSSGAIVDLNDNVLVGSMNSPLNPVVGNIRVLFIFVKNGDKIYGYCKKGKTKYNIK